MSTPTDHTAPDLDRERARWAANQLRHEVTSLRSDLRDVIARAQEALDALDRTHRVGAGPVPTVLGQAARDAETHAARINTTCDLGTVIGLTEDDVTKAFAGEYIAH